MFIKSTDYSTAIRMVRNGVDNTLEQGQWAWRLTDHEIVVREDIFNLMIDICFAADRLSFSENSGGLTSYSKTLDGCLDALAALKKIVDPVPEQLDDNFVPAPDTAIDDDSSISYDVDEA